MREFRLVVAASAPHRRWREDWCAAIGTHARLVLTPVDMLADAQGEDEVALPPGTDAVVLLVNADTAGWARALLPRLAARGIRTLLATRSLRIPVVRELLRCGGCDFLAWDCHADELRLRLQRLCDDPPSSASTELPRGGVREHAALRGIIGSSPAFLRQLDRIPVLAGCDAGVLILGETGTGKELVAQAVHYLSPRAGKPWVAVNCGALPSELVESELFGHVRGAFTHAHDHQRGLVAEAEGGTLFLDEVDSLLPAAQVKLLRFLQDKEFRPVGATRTTRADVRVIAASNGNLGQLAAEGAFRPDLYYRLNVLTLTLPPLRDRREDIPALAAFFVERFASEFRRDVTGLSTSARECLAAHGWPGNIRELQHAIERGVLLAPGSEVLAGDLGIGNGDDMKNSGAPANSFQLAKARAVALFERDYIERVLAQHGGNITHAADAARKNRRAFWQLIRKHGIDSAKFRGRA